MTAFRRQILTIVLAAMCSFFRSYDPSPPSGDRSQREPNASNPSAPELREAPGLIRRSVRIGGTSRLRRAPLQQSSRSPSYVSRPEHPSGRAPPGWSSCTRAWRGPP
eukprot:scaffold4543_cov126-Isochrysis_galbana.AAC.7